MNAYPDHEPTNPHDDHEPEPTPRCCFCDRPFFTWDEARRADPRLPDMAHVRCIEAEAREMAVQA